MIRKFRRTNRCRLIGLLTVVAGVLISVPGGYAAVTYTKPVSVSNVLDEVIAEDDWFAEIDDMIQDMAVPASTREGVGEQPDVQFETNRVQRAVQKKTLPPEKRSAGQPQKRFVKAESESQVQVVSQPEEQGDVQSPGQSANVFVERVEEEGADTDAVLDEASIFAVETESYNKTPTNTVSSSVIQEILRSDYWLEEESVLEKTPLAVKPSEPAPEPEQVEMIETPDVYSAAPVEKMTVEQKQSAEEQLLSLERELLQDINTGMEDQSEEPVQKEEAPGMSIVESDLMAVSERLDNNDTQEAGEEEELPVVSDALEDELLAELDTFIEQEEPETVVDSQPSEKTEEQIELDASLALVESEPIPAPEDASELDAVLEMAEKQKPAEPEQTVAEPSLLQDTGIEELNKQLSVAIANGDRDEILRISSAMAQRAETLPQDQPKDAQPQQPSEAKHVQPQPKSAPEKTYETQQAQKLAAPDRHIKRFARADLPEEKTPMRKRALSGTEKTSRPAAPAKRFEKQQVMVMKPSANQTPLKQSEKQAPEKQPPQTRTDEVSPAEMPSMRSFPKIDTSVFLRSAPASEMRVQKAVKPIQDDGSKNVKVVVPGTQADSDSLDAPVPFAW